MTDESVAECIDTDPVSVTEFLERLGIKQLHRSAPKAGPIQINGLQMLSKENQITEGIRNDSLTSAAGRLRHLGLERDQIVERLLEINLTSVSPSLDDAEVMSIADSVSKYPVPAYRYVGASQSVVLDPFTDTANARKLVAMTAPHLIYVPEWGRWCQWQDGKWVVDRASLIYEIAKRVSAQLLIEAQSVLEEKKREAQIAHARKTGNLPRIKAMVELAQSDPEVLRSASLLDIDDDLLGVANGVVNLRTGEFRPSRPEDLITRYSPVVFDHAAKCPTWYRFLNRVLKNSPSMGSHIGRDANTYRLPDRAELQAYLQRVVGYVLSGHTDEQVLFFLYGSGANGKTTFVKTLETLLGGELAKQILYDTLVAHRGPRSSSNDIARLQGVRAVFTNEIEDGTQLAESLIKQLTGGDTVAARFLYQEFIEFRPKFKLFISGNHKPIIKGSDDGIWRRIQLIPFEVQIPPEDRDHLLAGKLRAELPGILNWAIRGYAKWRRQGLAPPACVRAASEEYRDEMDLLQQWLEERCVLDPDSSARAQDLYFSYSFWTDQQNITLMSQPAFGRKLGDRFKKTRRSAGNVYLGLRLRKNEPHDLVGV